MTRAPHPDDLVGATEIARRLGTGSSVVHDWLRRYPEFPQPLVKLAMGNIWWWPSIEAWARSTNRLPST